MDNLQKVRNLCNALYYNEKQAGVPFVPDYELKNFNNFIKNLDHWLSLYQQNLAKDAVGFSEQNLKNMNKGLRNARRNIWEYLETQKEKEELQDDNTKENK